MVIFHSYVKLPESTPLKNDGLRHLQDGAPKRDVNVGELNPRNTIVISAINHRFNGSYWHQLSDLAHWGTTLWDDELPNFLWEVLIVGLTNFPSQLNGTIFQTCSKPPTRSYLYKKSISQSCWPPTRISMTPPDINGIILDVIIYCWKDTAVAQYIRYWPS